MRIQVWAHRGASVYTPGSTSGAFSLVVEQGADGVELDVRLARDHQLVVVHDETIDRVSDEFGYTEDHTLSQLRKLYLNKLLPEYHQASIPTSRKVYELLKPTGLAINVKPKIGIVRYEGIEEETFSLTTEMGMEDRVIHFSLYYPSPVRPRELDPSTYIGLLYSDDWLGVASYGRSRVHANALHPVLYHIQDEGLVPATMAWELGLHVWAVSKEPRMEMLIKQGIEVIITDKPDLCRSVVDRVG